MPISRLAAKFCCKWAIVEKQPTSLAPLGTELQDFTTRIIFYGPEEYQEWLFARGFHVVRVELIPKDMQDQGAEGLLGRRRTTLFPYTDRLPVELQDTFLEAPIAVDHLTQSFVFPD